MSYRLISTATLSLDGSEPRPVDIRAYPEPKRPPVGELDLDGSIVPFKRTGGKGRGLSDTAYVYVPFRGESAYFALTLAESAALSKPGAKLAILSAAKPEAPAPEAPKAKRREKA